MNNKEKIVILITLVLSFCSICYELILAQALSAFLENTVLRYSITIGLYLCAMGIGARIVEGRVLRWPVFQLLKVEIVLTLVGGFLIMGIYTADYIIPSIFIFKIWAHLLIIFIGILTGMELPFLMEILKDYRADSENFVLGYSYVGAVIGTIIFAFFFYPNVGLLNTSLIVGGLNGVAGLLLNYCKSDEDKEKGSLFYLSLYIQLFLCVAIFICLFYSNPINQFFVDLYLKKGA